MAEQQQSFDRVVEIPGVGTVGIPSDFTPEEVARFNANSTREYKKANPGKKQPPVTSWVDTAVDWLPTVGAIAGGAVAGIGGTAFTGPGGVLVGAAGAGLGGMIGESAKESINALRGRGPLKTAPQSITAVGLEGAKDAASALVGGGVLKGAGMAAPVVGRGLTATGEAMQSGAELLRHLIHFPGWKGKVAALAIKPLVSAGGKVVAAAGGQLEKVGAKEAARAALKGRLDKIALNSRLDQFAESARAVPAATTEAASSLVDDVALIRESVSKGMPSDTAIRIVADGSAEYASALKRGFVDSLKASGVPVPDAVQKLMKASSFAKLPQ